MSSASLTMPISLLQATDIEVAAAVAAEAALRVTGDSTEATARDVAIAAAVAAASTSWKTSCVVGDRNAGDPLATGFENGDSLNGVVLVTGDRILLQYRADAKENGIYTVNASGAPTRAVDANSAAELVFAVVQVQQGTVVGGNVFVCTNTSITLGVTNITFVSLGSLLLDLVTTASLSTQLNGLSTAIASTYQPLDADLTAIAAVASQTSFGQALLATVNAAGLRTTAALVSAPLRGVQFSFGDGVSVPTAGTITECVVPYTGTITSATLLSKVSGSCTITVKKVAYGSYPGSLASIVASAKPTLSSAQKSQDATLTGWTTSVTAGDVLEFTLDTVTSCLRISGLLAVTGN